MWLLQICTSWCSASWLDHSIHDFVRRKLLGIHDALGLMAQRRPSAHSGPQHVARSQMTRLVRFLDLWRLRALSRARRPQQHHPHPTGYLMGTCNKAAVSKIQRGFVNVATSRRQLHNQLLVVSIYQLNKGNGDVFIFNGEPFRFTVSTIYRLSAITPIRSLLIIAISHQ